MKESWEKVSINFITVYNIYTISMLRGRKVLTKRKTLDRIKLGETDKPVDETVTSDEDADNEKSIWEEDERSEEDRWARLVDDLTKNRRKSWLVIKDALTKYHQALIGMW